MPYDEWNALDVEDEELQDTSFFQARRDVILFCIDCSESMQTLRDDPVYEDVQSSHLLIALDAALQVQKKKVLSGPNDYVGIMLYNTTRKNETDQRMSEIKKGASVYQSLAPINAPTIQDLIRLIDEARDDPQILRNMFPPGSKMPMGDVFTSCNWVLRDSAPKTASKRVFLITDDDSPNLGSTKLLISARTTLMDLTQSGCQLEPFFISTPEHPFDISTFYAAVLPANVLGEDESADPDVLPESASITRIDDLLEQMRFHEQPKRALFSVPFELGNGFTIGVKGYGLVTEQQKGSYRYFVDLGDRMVAAVSRTVYVDEAQEREVDRDKVLFGMKLGVEIPGTNEAGGDEEPYSRVVRTGRRPFYTAEEIQSFRTMGLEPGIKLLGFKDVKELLFDDNIKHSVFIYPDELTYSGSKRTFSALLHKMLEKEKLALVRVLFRRNSVPQFCAMLPQAEKTEKSGWSEPAGFHLIVLPFADDIRAAPLEGGIRASDDVKNAAREWIDKLGVKTGAFPPDSYPNPALAFHNAQLQASAFREEFDVEAFEDVTRPKYDMIHKRAGALLKEWKRALAGDESFNQVLAIRGTKRKADVTMDEAEIRNTYEENRLDKLRVDQLKEFLKNKGQPVSGIKSVLVERVGEWLDTHG